MQGCRFEAAALHRRAVSALVSRGDFSTYGKCRGRCALRRPILRASAARAHGLHLWEVDSVIHLTQPSNISFTSHAPEVRNHKGRLEPYDVVRVGDLPVTSLERTVVDCARILPFKQALVVAERALQKGASKDFDYAPTSEVLFQEW